MANVKILTYLNRFKEIYNGSPWYGESISTKLFDVSDKNAFTQPDPTIHSIAALVKHMTYWRQALISRLEGDKNFKASMESPDNWITSDALRAIGWEKIFDAFEASQKKLTELLSKQDDEILSQEYSKGSTYDQLIQGIIDHDVYHLGQIAIVKSWIKNSR